MGKQELTLYIYKVLSLLKDNQVLHIRTFARELVEKFPDKCKDVKLVDLRLVRVLERSKEYERYKGYIRRKKNYESKG
jgi:hypothetical protein